MATNSFDARFIIQDVTRGLYHSLIKKDLYKEYEEVPANTPTYTFFHDFIPRKSTSSACVLQGVKKNEDPAHATLWAVVGFPLTSVVVPLWVKGGDSFPQILKRDVKTEDSPLCNAALTLKDNLFNIRWGKYAAQYYMNINALVNADNTGIKQKIKTYEDHIFKLTEEKLKEWRVGKMEKSEIKAYYDTINEYIINMYKKEFDLVLN